MLWSLIKVLIFVAVVAGLTLGAGYLLHAGGQLVIAVQGWEVTLGPIQAIVAALVLVGLVWLLIRLVALAIATVRFLNGDETALTRHFTRNRERKGFDALAEALMALASGEARQALGKAGRAEKFLQKPHLTNLIAAQAAEMAGDTAKATEVYKRLLADDRTRFAGVRGILKQKLAEGDTDTALKLAEKAFALKPKQGEMQDTLLQLQAGAGDWKGARATLQAKRQAGNLPRDIHKRRDAVLALQQARALAEAGNAQAAGEAAIAANRESPDLVPAAAMAARADIGAGRLRQAAKVIRKAWEAMPHPELAAAFAEIAPDETPAERLKRFRHLTDIRPKAEESRLLLAELNIAAEDFAAARKALGDLPETHPTARALTIMAAIERGEGSDDAVVRGWLTRALTASRGPQWVCDKCSTPHTEWTPVCKSCGSVDTLSWRELPVTPGPSATGSEMLPLIVGAPAERAAQAGTGAAEPAEVEEAEVIEPAPESAASGRAN
jgi:HemY protein